MNSVGAQKIRKVDDSGVLICLLSIIRPTEAGGMLVWRDRPAAGTGFLNVGPAPNG